MKRNVMFDCHSRIIVWNCVVSHARGTFLRLPGATARELGQTTAVGVSMERVQRMHHACAPPPTHTARISCTFAQWDLIT